MRLYIEALVTDNDNVPRDYVDVDNDQDIFDGSTQYVNQADAVYVCILQQPIDSLSAEYKDAKELLKTASFLKLKILERDNSNFPGVYTSNVICQPSSMEGCFCGITCAGVASVINVTIG